MTVFPFQQRSGNGGDTQKGHKRNTLLTQLTSKKFLYQISDHLTAQLHVRTRFIRDNCK